MFFVFSKILAFLLAPMLHGPLCLLASGLFLLIKAKFLARLCLILAGALPLLYSWTFFGAQLVRPLENYADIHPKKRPMERLKNRNMLFKNPNFDRIRIFQIFWKKKFE